MTLNKSLFKTRDTTVLTIFTNATIISPVAYFPCLPLFCVFQAEIGESTLSTYTAYGQGGVLNLGMGTCAPNFRLLSDTREVCGE